MPRALFEREIAHRGIAHLRVVQSMHERKKLMADLADAFIALPGGTGTLEEIFEQWTWSQLGMNGYFAPLVLMIEHMVAERFLSPSLAAMIVIEDEPDKLLARFRHYQPPLLKWSNEPNPKVQP